MSDDLAKPTEIHVPKWRRNPTSCVTSYHVHFDCFSGAAGDMILAACFDAANSIEDDGAMHLCEHIKRCLKFGLPEIADEFDISFQRVWRGVGSIAAIHVNVSSIYDHTATPVPAKQHDKKQSSSVSVHDSEDHSNNKSHQHSHDHSHQQSHDHSHQHSHDHSHDNSHHHSHSHSHDNSNVNLQKEISGENEPANNNEHNHHHQHNSNNEHPHQHNHHHNQSAISNIKGPVRNLPEIKQILENSSIEYIPEWVRTKAIESFTVLAHAEATVHGAAGIDAVHFHEVGAIDSIVDMVGSLLALYYLGVETISCSRLPIGEGTVRTAHGILPVPAPATLFLMKDMPLCPGPAFVTGELVTPTGAALLRTLCHNDTKSKDVMRKVPPGRPPNFVIRHIGIGAGTKDFKNHPNILRLLLGDSISQD